MINATTALTIAETVEAGETPSSLPSTERQGNSFLDEANLSIVFASMRGEKKTYITLSFPKTVIENGVLALESLGFNVDRNRERSYGELIIKWG